MRVYVVNNVGGGFANYKQVAEGSTIGALFDDITESGNPENFLIRVNGEGAVPSQVLEENDRVTITPTKMKGQSL